MDGNKTIQTAGIPAGDITGITERIIDTPAGVFRLNGDTSTAERLNGDTGIDVSRRCRLAVYVPSTGKDQTAIPQREFTSRTDQVSRFMSRLFGGVTVIPSAGYWVTDTNSLLWERINIVYAFTAPADLAEHYERLIGAVNKYRDLWYQTAISVDLDGTMILI